MRSPHAITQQLQSLNEHQVLKSVWKISRYRLYAHFMFIPQAVLVSTAVHWLENNLYPTLQLVPSRNYGLFHTVCSGSKNNFFLPLNHALNPKLTSLLLSIRIKIEWVITPIYIGSCRVDGQSGLTFDSPPPTNSDRTVITVNFRKQ